MLTTWTDNYYNQKLGLFMKSDTLTVAAVVLVLGIIATGLGLTDWNNTEEYSPTDLQRGFQVEESK